MGHHLIFIMAKHIKDAKYSIPEPNMVSFRPVFYDIINQFLKKNG